MAEPIQNLFPGVDIEFEFLISTKTIPRVSGFLATPDNRLNNLKESGNKNGVKKPVAWLEATHSGTKASLTALVRDKDGSHLSRLPLSEKNTAKRI